MRNPIFPPDADEYARFYADYVQRTAQRTDVDAALLRQIDELHAALDPLSDSPTYFELGPQEWSMIREVIADLKEEAADRHGIASGHGVSARARICMLVDHVYPHMASLHEKHLPVDVTP